MLPTKVLPARMETDVDGAAGHGGVRVGARTEPGVVVLAGHDDAVSGAVFSPDGRRLATASDDKTARVWSAATGQLLIALEGHTDFVNTAAFSADGQRVVTASDDKTARVWSTATGQLAHVLRHARSVATAAFSSDGRRIVTNPSGLTPRVWNATTGQAELQLEGHSRAVSTVAFSPDGRRVLSASSDKTARVWSLVMGHAEHSLQGHTSYVNGAVFSPDGQRILTASDDKTARVWSTATGQLLATLEGHTRDVEAAVWSPDARRILTRASGQVVRLWSGATGQLEHELEGHTDYVNTAAFSPDGRRVVTACDDKAVRVWDAATGQLLRTLRGSTADVMAALFSPDGQRVVSWASDEPVARVWSAETGAAERTLEGHSSELEAAAFSPDGQRVATASRDGTARVWSLATGALELVLAGHTKRVNSVSFSPDGRRILTGSHDKTARVWDAATGAACVTLADHSGSLTSALFSPDGGRVLTACDESARVWDAATGRLEDSLDVHTESITSAVFSPDGQRILTASYDNTTRVWGIVDHLGNYALPLLLRLCDTALKSRDALEDRLGRRPPSAVDTYVVGQEASLPHAVARSDNTVALEVMFKAAVPSGGLLVSATQRGAGDKAWWAPSPVRLAMDFKQGRSLKLLLDQVAASCSGWTAWRRGEVEALPPWSIAPTMFTHDATLDLVQLIDDHPTLAANFLTALGLVRAGPGLDMAVAPGEAPLTEAHIPHSGLIIAGSSKTGDDHGLWSFLARDEKSSFVRRQRKLAGSPLVPVEAYTVPFPYPAGMALSATPKETRAGLPTFYYGAAGDKGGDSGPPSPFRQLTADEAGQGLLHHLLAANEPRLFDNDIAKSVVQFKWQAYGEARFLREMYLYLVGLVLLTAAIFLVGFGEAGGAGSATDIVAMAVFGLVGLLALRDVYHEAQQALAAGVGDYLEDAWNLLDAVILALTLAAVAGNFAGWEDTRVVLALAVYCKWLGLLFFFQAFESTGPLVRMVLQIVADMRYILLVLVVALLATASAFYVLLDVEEAAEGFADPADALFTMFNMLLLADFDVAGFAVGRYEIVLRLLFIGSMLFVPIILLNLLIALMSDSYERIQDQAEVEFLRLRAGILVETELFFSDADRDNRAFFPERIHILRARDGSTAAGTAWHGVLNALKQDLQKVAKAQDGLRADVLASQDKHRQELQQQQAETQAQLKELKAMLKATLARRESGTDADFGFP